MGVELWVECWRSLAYSYIVFSLGLFSYKNAEKTPPTTQASVFCFILSISCFNIMVSRSFVGIF